MVFSRKLAGAIAVAAALAVTPAAGAAPTGPGDEMGGATPTQPMAACSSLWDAAKLASNLYWASTHGGPPLSADDYNDLRASYLAAVAEYDRRHCRTFMGAPPAWGARP